MTFYPLATPDGADPHLLLGPPGTFPATIPFEPSVFGGDKGGGGGPRKAIRFAIRDERVSQGTQNLEQKAQRLLAKVSPTTIWNSAITEATELYPSSTKANIWGDRRASRTYPRRWRRIDPHARAALAAAECKRGKRRPRHLPYGHWHGRTDPTGHCYPIGRGCIYTVQRRSVLAKLRNKVFPGTNVAMWKAPQK